MRKKGKKYVQALELIEKGKAYTKEEAVESTLIRLYLMRTLIYY